MIITFHDIFHATYHYAGLLSVFGRYSVRLGFNLPNEQSFYLVTIHCGNIRARPRCNFIVLFRPIIIIPLRDEQTSAIYYLKDKG